MAAYQVIIRLLCLFLWLPHLSGNEKPLVKQIIFSMHSGDLSHSLELYQEYRKELGHHDLELLQQIGLIVLDRGLRSNDPEIQLLTFYGAGIANQEKCLYILEEGFNSRNPQLQLVALNMLVRYHIDQVDDALNKALGSPHLLIRLEALSHLVDKKHPKAAGQIEALMGKVDEDLHPLFPPLFAKLGNAEATRGLKKLFTHSSEAVRVAAILSAAKYGRDDLLPQIRRLAKHHDLAQQEACALALGEMGDETMIPRLESMTASSAPTLKLAALSSLYKLGKKETHFQVEKCAKEGNLYAIRLLGKMRESKETLAGLVQNPNLQVRINAGLSLLELQDPRCLKVLMEILLQDKRDLIFTKSNSMSTALICWKANPSATQNFKADPTSFELSLEMREDALALALELPPKYFLEVSESLFEHHQMDLIPALVEELEKMNHPDSIALLKKYEHKAGAPLIRNYCNLALFNLKEPGPYAENVRAWITGKQVDNIINSRPYVPTSEREYLAHYEITPHEISHLLVSAFESFAKMQNEEGIDVLLEALSHGNTKNRYALVGLLIRTTM